MIKTDRHICVKRQHGHAFYVVREHYLREDIPCFSELCLADCNCSLSNNKTTVMLPRDCTHYVVPDCLVVMKYLDIFELAQIQNIIMMQTVSNTIQHESGRRHYRRLQNLVKDQSQNAILFHNEFQKYAFCKRKENETKQEWWSRSVYDASVWYFNHLAGQMPIVMVTSDPKVVTEYKHKTAGVLVLSMQEYLQNFWPDLEAADLLYKSLSASEQITSEKDTDFSGYLPQEMLDAGLKSGLYTQGSLQVSKYNAATEAFIKKSSHTKDTNNEGEVLVHGSSHRNRAVHGDTVVIEMLPRQQWKNKSNKIKESTEASTTEGEESEASEAAVMPTGRVVGVLQRNWRDYVVSFSEEQTGQQNKAGKVLVIPWDRRIPKIRISTRQVEALKTQRIVVRLDNWERDSQYPNGHFVRSLGPIGELETEVAALLVENQISVAAFTDSLVKELPTNSAENPWKMDEKEISKRRDIRQSHLVFSIDPKGCEDVDDTLSVRKLDNGNTELGVHIADVTYFVRPDTLTDTEARSRSTTVYLADRRYDMLPAVLSSDLCSLISGVDRYAMSVIWELDANYEVQNVWYGRTVIRSKYKLFYEIAQQIHDGVGDDVLIENIPELQTQSESEQGQNIEELRWSVLSLMEIARGLKRKRTRHGALELEGLELRVQIKEGSKQGDSQIEDLLPKQALEIHETIAECMIFANHWVAKKICQAYPNCAILRHHPLPREEFFVNLIKCAASKGFNVKTRTNKELAESLDRCVDPSDPEVNKLLRLLATQAMSNAAYFSTGSLDRNQFFHYGLALDYYTHFTSPIRRYADILVHRLLLSSLKVDDGSKLLTNTDLQDLCQHINTKHRAAQDAQRSSQELFQTLFFREKSPEDESCVVNAVIYQLKANGLLVFIPRYSMKGPVYLRSKEGQVLYVPQSSSPEWVGGTISLTDSSLNVNSAYGDQKYQLFDHITVRVSVKEMHAHSSAIRLDLLYKRKHSAQISQSEARKQKGVMIQEVQEQADERRRNQEVVELGEDFLRWKAEYGQTSRDSSFYCLLQSFHTMAMLDV